MTLLIFALLFACSVYNTNMRFLFDRGILKKSQPDIIRAIKNHPEFKKGYNTKKLDGMTLTMDASPPAEFIVAIKGIAYIVGIKAFDGEIHISKERLGKRF